MKQLLISIFISICWLNLNAQNKNLPIIDMHLHALNQYSGIVESLPCIPQPCESQKTVIKDLTEILPQTVSEMKKHNVVLGIVTTNDLAELGKWKTYAPELFLLGFQFWDPLQPDITLLKKEYEENRLNILGEVGTQYNGFPPNDPRLEQFYVLAEEMDIPVLIHCASLADKSDAFNIKDGNPLLLEEVLKRHPGLRIYIENAGFPFAQEIIALMYRYPNVYADLSTISWIIPRKTFHKYLESLIEAKLGKRLMFGSDQMIWPETIGMAKEAIESSSFLSEEQKRDIFYNNAARFLRLSNDAIKVHHDKVANR